MSVRAGAGKKDDPWILTTPPGTSEYEMYRGRQCRTRGARLPGRLYQAALSRPVH
jgi:hypothetical protein